MFILSHFHEMSQSLGEQIGKGGMGVVFKAVDKRKGNHVAIKRVATAGLGK